MNRASTKKPQGQPTRGKTASNRLRRVDNFILLHEPWLLTRTDGLFARALFVDLGYGFDARTTLESAARFRRINPHLPILAWRSTRKGWKPPGLTQTTKHSFAWAGSICPCKPVSMCA